MIKPTALKPKYTKKWNKQFQRKIKIETTELTLEPMCSVNNILLTEQPCEFKTKIN